jgi:2-polyprenyl-3-methyl-5-hydroxy-6-metoxy-1,4-benzoquinol methylase
MSSYQFGHEWEEERERLASIEEFNDPGTIGHLESLGVGPGWSCLEIGAGGGSVTAWLCERVGASGHVTATDLETGFVGSLDYPNLEVVRHDVAKDELPSGQFDLVHERAVLEHLPRRSDVLARLVEAARPGGWLLCEDTDFVTLVHGSRYPVVGKAAGAMVDFLRTTGADLDYGRELHSALTEQGLENVGAEGRAYVMRGAHRSSLVLRHTLERMREPVLAAGSLTEEELDEALAVLDDPRTDVMSPLMMAVWGRRPAA